MTATVRRSWSGHVLPMEKVPLAFCFALCNLSDEFRMAGGLRGREWHAWIAVEWAVLT